MADVTNPAQRLFDTLTRIQKGIREKVKIRNVVGDAFDVEATDDLKIIESLVLLDGLFVETTKFVYSIEGIDHSRYLQHFPQLRKNLLTSNIDADSKGLTTFSNALNPVALQSVGFCAARVAEDFKENILPQEELADLDEQIGDAFDFIAASDLEPKLKEISLDLLHTIRSAIAEYRIRGLRGLEESIELSLGKLSLYHMRFRNSSPK